MSIAAIFPLRTVKAMIENGFPSSMQTTPGAPLTSAGRLTRSRRVKLCARRATCSAPRTSIGAPAVARKSDQRVQRVRRHAFACAEEARREGRTHLRRLRLAEAPYYSDAERAALALTEAASRLSDRADPVPDEVWTEAARHYDETQLSALVMSIGMINLWNRLNATTRQVGGDFVEQYI